MPSLLTRVCGARPVLCRAEQRFRQQHTDDRPRSALGCKAKSAGNVGLLLSSVLNWVYGMAKRTAAMYLMQRLPPPYPRLGDVEDAERHFCLEDPGGGPSKERYRAAVHDVAAAMEERPRELTGPPRAEC
jgi:hypothetical protein